MRKSVIFVILTFCIVVRGWVAYLQPIAMSIGTALAVLNLDVDLISDLQPTALRNFFSKVKVTEEEKETSTVNKFDHNDKLFKKWSEIATN